MARPRSGFTLVEIVVVLVVVLAISAIVAPGMIGQIDQARVERSAESITALADAIDDPTRGGGAFRQHVGVYPGALSHLTRPISIADANICGVVYTAAEVAGWRGPYINRIVPPDGLPLPLGAARDTLVRELVGAAANPALSIVVAEVELDDARALDVLLDGVVGEASGGFRWDAPDVEGFVTARYLVPIKDC